VQTTRGHSLSEGLTQSQYMPQQASPDHAQVQTQTMTLGYVAQEEFLTRELCVFFLSFFSLLFQFLLSGVDGHGTTPFFSLPPFLSTYLFIFV